MATEISYRVPGLQEGSIISQVVQTQSVMQVSLTVEITSKESYKSRMLTE